MPVFLLIPIRAGLLKVDFVKKFRCIFVTGIFLVAALLTPPDIVSQLSLGVPGWLLFELTLLIAAKVQKKADTQEEEPEEVPETEVVVPPEKTAVSPVCERSRLAGRSGRIRKL